MNRTVSKERELTKRGKKPTTYRRIVTGNVNGKSVVQSDESLLAYQFKTVPGFEHTLMWINPAIPISAMSRGLTDIPTPLFQDLAVLACTS
jgi:hypothetical protein